MMDNKDLLRKLLEELREGLAVINQHPLVPGSMRNTVNTTFQILEILIAETSQNGQS